jgi:TfoX/Sxy family transcriptional regulator of competence genes
MAYDEELAARIRALMPDATEKKMFGGVAFLVDGNMALAASGQGGLLARVDPEQSAELVETTAARPMVMRGRQLAGWLRVDAVTDDELAEWLERALGYVRTLPPK